MFRKKLLMLPIVLLFVLSIIGLASAACVTTGTTSYSADFTSMINGTAQNFTIGADEQYSSIDSIVPSANISVEANESQTLVNGSAITLAWTEIDTGTVVVTNSTDNAVLGSGNYTVNDTLGTVTFDLSADAEGFNGSTVYVTYNKTFVEDVTDLTGADYTFSWEATGSADWGVDTGWRIIYNDLNNTDWTVGYTLTDRDCSAQTGCQATQTTIFAGFALLALFAIVGAGWMIVTIFQGGDIGTSAMITTIAVIGLGIVIFIGYIVISRVGAAVCL